MGACVRFRWKRRVINLVVIGSKVRKDGRYNHLLGDPCDRHNGPHHSKEERTSGPWDCNPLCMPDW
jgi:hypothetical protein